ncbi:MAG: hypothetical protein PHH28_09550 [Desulfuromonadaceae bacterium]|nr:hypothetical protein [Desulfuromonadaceae bacterium]
MQQRKMFSKVKNIKRDVKLLLRNIYESVLYRFARSRRASSYTRSVVFVCMGNICRSAFAEYLMRSITEDKILSIESCGLNVDMRTPSPLEAIITSKTFGLDLEGHLSKGLECCDLENSDLILAMELWQYKKLVELFPHKKENIKLLREFAPFPENILCNINDPFGQSEEIFAKCFSQIERSIHAMKARI